MIDYQKIQDSIEFFTNIGYTRIESPWTVTKAISAITKPSDREDFQLVHPDGKVLVASGEQSFLYLQSKGFLPQGRFQTVTPCFRKESFDFLHTKYFLKNELISSAVNELTAMAELELVMKSALEFFRRYVDCDIVENDEGNGYDICAVVNVPPSKEFELVELGSYGIRSFQGFMWVYGTACAEPRLTNIVNWRKTMECLDEQLVRKFFLSKVFK